MAAYIERGDLQFVFHHRIVLGPESQGAAEAVECAGDQGKYWAFHGTLMTSQRGVGKGAFSKANLNRFAKELGLDTAAFASCVDSRKYTEKVMQVDQEATAMGVEGTPNFLLGEKLIKGLPEVGVLIRMIDEELSKR